MEGERELTSAKIPSAVLELDHDALSFEAEDPGIGGLPASDGEGEMLSEEEAAADRSQTAVWERAEDMEEDAGPSC